VGKVFKAMSKAENTAIKGEEPQKPETAPGSAFAPEPAKPPVAATPAAERPEAAPPEGKKEALTAGAKAVPSKVAVRDDFSSAPLTARGWDERLVAALGSASVVAEEFRRLRTSILHPANGGKPPRTILVTSAAPGEGKTFVCGGLAVAMAQGVKEHALMIDCDLRRPGLAALFGQDNDQGLADHLRDGVELGRLLHQAGLSKLYLLPAGPPPANPAELLGSEKMVAMLSETRERYPDRYLIIDSPPFQQAAETAILAQLVDGVVLVVREGKSSREDVNTLVNSVGPEKIVGVVFNAYRNSLVERRLSGSYGGGYYYSSYGSGAR
jgi:protein-tyrosine kinase